MPGRKSTVSATPVEQDEPVEVSPSNAKASKDKEGMSVEDFSLPKSMIGRLAKGVLPPNTQIHKDALLALHKSATVFVSYLASNANEITRADGKKTIPPSHVMTAIKDAELDSFLPRLEAELLKYNEIQCDKRNTYRRRVKAEQKATDVPKDATPATGEGAEIMNGDAAASKALNGATNGHVGSTNEDLDRPFKKFKGVDGGAVARDTDGEAEDDDVDGDEPTNVDEQDEDQDEESDDGVSLGEEEGADEEVEDRMDDVEERGLQRDEALDYESD